MASELLEELRACKTMTQVRDFCDEHDIDFWSVTELEEYVDIVEYLSEKLAECDLQFVRDLIIASESHCNWEAPYFQYVYQGAAGGYYISYEENEPADAIMYVESYLAV